MIYLGTQLGSTSQLNKKPQYISCDRSAIYSDIYLDKVFIMTHVLSYQDMSTKRFLNLPKYGCSPLIRLVLIIMPIVDELC